VALVLPLLLCGMLFIAFAFFQPISPGLETAATSMTERAVSAFGAMKARLVGCVTCCFPKRKAHTEEIEPAGKGDSIDKQVEEHTWNEPSSDIVQPSSETMAPAEPSEMAAHDNTDELVATDVHFEHHEPSAKIDYRTAALEAREQGQTAQLAQAAAGIGMAGTALGMGSAMFGDDDDGDGNDGGDGSQSGDSFYGETGAMLELYYALQRLLEKAQKYGKVSVLCVRVCSTRSLPDFPGRCVL